MILIIPLSLTLDPGEYLIDMYDGEVIESRKSKSYPTSTLTGDIPQEITGCY